MLVVKVLFNTWSSLHNNLLKIISNKMARFHNKNENLGMFAINWYSYESLFIFYQDFGICIVNSWYILQSDSDMFCCLLWMMFRFVLSNFLYIVVNRFEHVISKQFDSFWYLFITYIFIVQPVCQKSFLIYQTKYLVPLSLMAADLCFQILTKICSNDI